jgi:DNA polymerase-1
MFDVEGVSEKNILLVLDLLKTRTVVGHNLQFDLTNILHKYGKEYLPKACFDTMIGYKLLWHALVPKFPRKGTFKLDSAAKHLLGIELDKSQQQSSWGRKNLTKKQLKYAVGDVLILKYLTKNLVRQLNRISTPEGEGLDALGNTYIIAQLENKFLRELVLIELAGVPVNSFFLKQDKAHVEGMYSRLAKKLCIDRDFKPTNPVQVRAELLKEGISVSSADKATLKGLPKCRLAQDVLEFRRLKSLKDHMRKLLPSRDGRAYSNFNQISSSSGRLSSSKPNIQSVPKPLKKNFYKAPIGRVVLKADYSQIELRVAAVLTDCWVMSRLFLLGDDIHSRTAESLSSGSTENLRDQAKAVNFGFLFGMSAQRFSEYALSSYNLKLSKTLSETYKRRFLKAYPGIRKFHSSTKNRLNHSGQSVTTEKGVKLKIIRTKTLYGRRNQAIGYNRALNIPIQGTGADILKLAVVEFGRLAREKNIDVQIINLVHDEIVVEASEKDKDFASDLLKASMEYACDTVLNRFKTSVTPEIL